MINILSLNSSQLTKNDINQILKLKKTHWNFDLNSQYIHFKNTVKKKDLHNLLYIKQKLIGYTLLRNSFYTHNSKKIAYLHFDTLIIDKKFRNKEIGKLLMYFNNLTIRNKKKTSFLYCEKKLEKFYTKCKWKVYRKNLKTPIIRKNFKTLMKFN